MRKTRNRREIDGEKVREEKKKDENGREEKTHE